jgi:hypothetical protein
MKTILTRTLLVTLVATSISAFAKSGDGKPDDAVTPGNVTPRAPPLHKVLCSGAAPFRFSAALRVVF